MGLEEDFLRMQAMTPEELYEQFLRERTRIIYYEGPLSVQESGSFWGVRLDGVSPDANFPEDCSFLDDVLHQRFGLPIGPWTEPAENQFRIIVERLEMNDE
jgi:hypothetical protein